MVLRRVGRGSLFFAEASWPRNFDRRETFLGVGRRLTAIRQRAITANPHLKVSATSRFTRIPHVMEPNFSLKDASRLLDKYVPLGEDDYTVPFLRVLLDYAPARENIIKDICNTESSQESSSSKNNGTDSLHLLYQWWRKYLILPCIMAKYVTALIF